MTFDLTNTSDIAELDSINIGDIAPMASMTKFKFNKPNDEIDSAIQAFLTGSEAGKFGRYYIHGDILVYKIAVTEELRQQRNSEDFKQSLIDGVNSGRLELINCTLADIQADSMPHGVKVRTCKANVIAQRVNANTYIGNSSALSLIGRSVSFGNERLNRDVTPIQERLNQYIPMIPFNVFKEANLDLTKYRLIDKGAEQNIVRKIESGKRDKKGEPIFKDVDVHFTGASLFEIEGQQFLFDIDRREIEHKIFNAFLVKLPKHVNTIEQAYVSLKPKEVLDAESKGLTVLRQGEWFFIPVKGEYEHDMRDSWRNAGKREPMPFTLKAGPNRPNTAQFGNTEMGYVKGLVEHSGREHAPLKLMQWYKPIPNTATESFTITGDVD